MYKQLTKRTQGSNFHQGLNDGCPFGVHFKGEGGYDCGGPRRDGMSNICKEIMSEALPFLMPTSNNTTTSGSNTDWYQINPKVSESYNFSKLFMFGQFLGWSLNCIGGMALDLPDSFWKRVCDNEYTLTLDDLESLDSFRHGMLKQMLECEKFEEEKFTEIYDGYTFEADFGTGDSVELCENGATTPLLRINVNEYVNLYLKAYSKLDQRQF